MNRRIGKVRNRGEKDGLTRADAERQLRRMIEAEAQRPQRIERTPTVDEAATALRERLAVEGAFANYLSFVRHTAEFRAGPATPLPTPAASQLGRPPEN